MTLYDPKPHYEIAKHLAALADANWDGLTIPSPIIDEFCKAWENFVGYEARPSGSQIRLWTSATNSEIIAHSDLAKAIATAPLRSCLHSYRSIASQLAEDYRIGNFKSDFAKQSNTPPPSWNIWQKTIDTITDLKDEEKDRLRNFLTDSDSFYGVKGISRDDFAAPALCKSIDRRIDRFSICDQIAAAASINPSIFQKIEEFLTAKQDQSILTKDQNMSFFPKRDRMRNLACSLLTKPFTILTGSSGTGKTKLAESLAHYLGNTGQDNHRMVAVGADWTDNRNVLGFVNHLRDDGTDERRPVYQSTPILDLLIDANETPETPFFLILDEMNLSHVERYFADFLSVMEQKEGGVFRLHTEGTGDNAESRLLRNSADKIGVPRNLPYPPNLFVVGTVNIDETTYMFSPKVLDRSNVIEFKVTDKEIGAYLDDPKGYPEMVKAPDGVADSFLVLALKARKGDLDDLPPEVSGAVKEHLLSLFRTMEEARFEFAYRTLNEVIRYVKVCQELAENKGEWQTKGWKADLDDQILQKILPKLHGSTGRISDLLSALAEYCRTGAVPAEGAVLPKLKDIAALECQEGGFEKSFNKLKSMAATLKSEQFVSFIQ